jgi:hypothetical protein
LNLMKKIPHSRTRKSPSWQTNFLHHSWRTCQWYKSAEWDREAMRNSEWRNWSSSKLCTRLWSMRRRSSWSRRCMRRSWRSTKR